VLRVFRGFNFINSGRGDGAAVLNAAMLGLDKEVGGRRMKVFPDSEMRLD
jgi:hypothetical protein